MEPATHRTVIRTVGDLPLFAEPTPPMTETPDYATSRAAADSVAPVTKQLQRALYRAIRDSGPEGATAKELERLPSFQHYGPSTVRKRVSELLKMGHIHAEGQREGCLAWHVNTPRGDR